MDPEPRPPGMGASETPGTSRREDAATFAAILEALAGVVSPALIDGAGWGRLRETAEELPVEPGAGFGFELRLGEPAAGTDFWASLLPNGALAEHYVELGGGAPPGSPEAAFGRHLATIRTDPGWVGFRGLEYDTSSGSTSGLPGYFVRIRPDSAGDGPGGFPGAETVARWIAGAVGWRLADGESRALAAAFDGFKDAAAAVDCVAVMPTRPERAFRVVSRPVSPSAVLPLLEGLRWKGPTAGVEAFLTDIEGLFRSLRLAVDVAADGIRPRAGLELFRGSPEVLNHPGIGGWGPCLARLRDAGLCLPEKMHGLLNWPGRELVFCGDRTFGLLTGLSHLKVSFEERESGVAVEAKAYPYAGFLPFDAALALSGSASGG